MNLKKVPQEDYEPQQHGPVFNFLYSLKTHFLTISSVNVLFLSGNPDIRKICHIFPPSIEIIRPVRCDF